MKKLKSLAIVALIFSCCQAHSEEKIDTFSRFTAAMELASAKNITPEQLEKVTTEAKLAAQEIQTSKDPDTVMSGVINEAYANLAAGSPEEGFRLMIEKAPNNVSPAMAAEFLFTSGAIEYSFNKSDALLRMNSAISKAGPSELQTHFIMLRDKMLGHSVPIVLGSDVAIRLDEKNSFSHAEINSNPKIVTACVSQMTTVCERQCYSVQGRQFCDEGTCYPYDVPKCSNPPITP